MKPVVGVWVPPDIGAGGRDRFDAHGRDVANLIRRGMFIPADGLQPGCLRSPI